MISTYTDYILVKKENYEKVKDPNEVKGLR